VRPSAVVHDDKHVGIRDQSELAERCGNGQQYVPVFVDELLANIEKRYLPLPRSNESNFSTVICGVVMATDIMDPFWHPVFLTYTVKYTGFIRRGAAEDSACIPSDLGNDVTVAGAWESEQGAQ
jgi:hypothetical protein